jgi:hypothetical protein
VVRGPSAGAGGFLRLAAALPPRRRAARRAGALHGRLPGAGELSPRRGALLPRPGGSHRAAS